MSGNSRKEQEALFRLADILVADVLEMSDEEIVAEAKEDGADAAQEARATQALFERTVAAQGKATLAAAKAAARSASRSEATVADIDREKARRKYDAILAGDRSLAEKMTLAARKGEGTSERDIESALEDLIELGALDDEDTDK